MHHNNPCCPGTQITLERTIREQATLETIWVEGNKTDLDGEPSGIISASRFTPYCGGCGKRLTLQAVRTNNLHLVCVSHLPRRTNP